MCFLQTKVVADESARSLQSGPSSTSTKATNESLFTGKHFELYYLNKEPVVARKHVVRVDINSTDRAQFRNVSSNFGKSLLSGLIIIIY
jgi:hypothetical protein